MLNRQLFKVKFDYSILIIISLILLMSESMRLYFTWTLSKFLIYFIAFFLCLLYIFFHPHRYKNVYSKRIVPMILLILTLFYDLIFITNITFISVLAFLFSIFCAVFLLLSSEVIQFKLLKWITNFMAIIVAISLFGWILFLLGFSLPHYYSETDAFYTHTVYYLFLLNGTPAEQLIPRFCGMFLEPGHLGTTCCFLLYLNKFNLKKIQNIIFLIAILFSLSLAAYGLLFGGAALYLFLNSKKKLLYILLFIIVVAGTTGISLKYNQGDNILNNLIFSRLEIKDGDIVGNNRITSDFERQFNRYVKSNELVLGKGRAAYLTTSSTNLTYGCASWKRYLYVRGIVGTVLLSFFLIIYLCKEWSPLGFGFFILFVVGNMIRDYPLKELWLYLYIIGIPYFRELMLLNKNRVKYESVASVL